VSRHPKHVLRDLRLDLAACLRETYPGRQFGNHLILGLVWLSLLARHIQETQNPNQRKELFDEFHHGARTIRKAIGLLRQTRKTTTPHQTRHQPGAVPGMRRPARS